jgi:S-adenosylmethionine:tRNA ribosyltransferase-isomerase
MDVAGFDYELPSEAIAQVPASPRDASRLLVARDPVEHRRARDLPSLLRPGDLLVLNDTRVLHARLRLRKPTGGEVEVLALEPMGECSWEALVRPSRRVPDGTVLVDQIGTPVLEVGLATGSGTRRVTPVATTMSSLMASEGVVPLPPYITAPLEDPERYQTVFAQHPSSVAAPTAGLHLTPDVLARCRAAGAEVATIDLSVGIGTFRPIEAANLDGHEMHGERFRVESSVWEACRNADRVVAVGTTVVRTLESVAAGGRLEGRTNLFIRPGHRWSVVDALMTNFHLPRSSLLVMVESFMGPRWRDVYRLALEEGYRFLSFGDAMFVERSDTAGRAAS